MRKPWLRTLFRQRILVICLMLLQIYLMIRMVASGSSESQFFKWTMTAVSVFVSLFVITRREHGAYKLTWVFLILLFPVFGGIFYLAFGFQLSRRRYTKRLIAIEKQSKSSFLLPGDVLKQAQEQYPDQASQIRYLQDFAGFPICENTKATYLTPGEKFFFVLKRELEKAEHYIFLEYFIIQEGEMWNSILEILKRKVQDGVLVRLLYDDLGCFFLLPGDYPKQLRAIGIECTVFNPFRPLITTIQNNRDHHKIAVVDGKVAFTGGINLADEYINAIDKHGHWKDAAVMVEGKAAWSFTLMFLQMWELCQNTKEDFSTYYPWKESSCVTPNDGFAQPYADSPIDTENVGEHVYLQIIQNAKKYVSINTPYLIVDDNLVSALTLAAKSGVDVRIVTPHRWDKWLVHMTTRSYYRQLIRAGVKVFEYSNGFIHSKTFVSDDVVATVGTTNLDFRSLYLHFECGVRLQGSTAVNEIKDDFLNTLNDCMEIREIDCIETPLLRLLQEVFRLFAPLM